MLFHPALRRPLGDFPQNIRGKQPAEYLPVFKILVKICALFDFDGFSVKLLGADQKIDSRTSFFKLVFGLFYRLIKLLQGVGAASYLDPPTIDQDKLFLNG